MRPLFAANGKVLISAFDTKMSHENANNADCLQLYRMKMFSRTKNTTIRAPSTAERKAFPSFSMSAHLCHSFTGNLCCVHGRRHTHAHIHRYAQLHLDEYLASQRIVMRIRFRSINSGVSIFRTIATCTQWMRVCVCVSVSVCVRSTHIFVWVPCIDRRRWWEQWQRKRRGSRLSIP